MFAPRLLFPGTGGLVSLTLCKLMTSAMACSWSDHGERRLTTVRIGAFSSPRFCWAGCDLGGGGARYKKTISTCDGGVLYRDGEEVDLLVDVASFTRTRTHTHLSSLNYLCFSVASPLAVVSADDALRFPHPQAAAAALMFALPPSSLDPLRGSITTFSSRA